VLRVLEWRRFGSRSFFSRLRGGPRSMGDRGWDTLGETAHLYWHGTLYGILCLYM
jgi:hypothetical protein